MRQFCIDWGASAKTWADVRFASLLPRHLQARLLGGWFWSLAGALASQTGILGSSILVARLLGVEQYGRFALLQSTVVMLGILAGLGLGITTTRAVAALRDTRPGDAGRIIGFCLTLSTAAGALISVLFYWSASWFSAAVFGSAGLSTELRIASLLLLTNTIAATQSATLMGFEAFRSLAGTGVARGAVSPVLVVAGTLNYGLRGAIGGLVAGTLVQIVWNQVLILRQCERHQAPLSVRLAGSDFGVLWRTSLPALLSSAIVVPANWVTNVFLSRIPGGFTELAVFSAANQWRTGIQFVPTLLGQVSLPMLSSLHHRREVAGYRAVLRTGLLLVAGMTSCAAVGVSLCSPLIMRAYGPDYVRGIPVLIALSAAAAAGATCQVIGNAIASVDRMWWGLAFNAVWVVILLLFARVLAPQWGALGVACAVLIAYVVHGGLVAGYTRRARIFSTSGA